MWTSNRGVIFLLNIGGEYRRCAIQDARGTSLSNLELATCNGAAGDVLIAPRYAAPLRRCNRKMVCQSGKLRL